MAVQKHRDVNDATPGRNPGNRITDAQMRQMRDKSREMVKGIFRFHEVPGGVMEFIYREYRQDPVERFNLVDGEVYTLPLGVARHLNKNIKYPIHAYMTDASGAPIAKANQWVRRCSFQSLEFVDIEDLTPVGGTIIEAQQIGVSLT